MNNKLIKQETNKSSQRVYPFVDELVDKLYVQCDELIDKHIDVESEKSIFMMFVVMYFAVHLKIKSNIFAMSDTERKETIKQILTEFIRNPEKRSLCIQHFESKFRYLFHESSAAIDFLPQLDTTLPSIKSKPDNESQ
jgi:hypothetical protein